MSRLEPRFRDVRSKGQAKRARGVAALVEWGNDNPEMFSVLLNIMDAYARYFREECGHLPWIAENEATDLVLKDLAAMKGRPE